MARPGFQGLANGYEFGLEPVLQEREVDRCKPQKVHSYGRLIFGL